MTTFAELDRQLTGRSAQRRKLENHTYANRRPNGDIAVTLHATDVVTYHPDGSCTLSTGGWYTVTTKARLNTYGPASWHVGSDKGRWQLYSRDWTAHVPFVDGITIRADGQVASLPRLLAHAESVEAEVKATRRAIAKYVREYVAELAAGTMPAPSGADCWGCAFGMAPGGCLQSHIDEAYHVPSLAVRALEATGRRPLGVQLALNWTPGHFGGPTAYAESDRRHYAEVGRAIGQYMRRALIPGTSGSHPE